MIQVTVSDHTGNKSLFDVGRLENSLSDALSALMAPDGFIEVTLIDDERMRELNRSYRHVDRSTNVLSFSMLSGFSLEDQRTWPVRGKDDPPVLYGEVIISLETVFRDAEMAGIPFEEELFRISIHGILHLLGYDHDTDKAYSKMTRQETYLLQRYNQRGERGDNV